MTATTPAAPAKAYFTNLCAHGRESQLDKLRRLIHRADIEQIDFENKFVAIKIHFGELGNLGFANGAQAARVYSLAIAADALSLKRVFEVVLAFVPEANRTRCSIIWQHSLQDGTENWAQPKC